MRHCHSVPLVKSENSTSALSTEASGKLVSFTLIIPEFRPLSHGFHQRKAATCSRCNTIMYPGPTGSSENHKRGYCSDGVRQREKPGLNVVRMMVRYLNGHNHWESSQMARTSTRSYFCQWSANYMTKLWKGPEVRLSIQWRMRPFHVYLHRAFTLRVRNPISACMILRSHQTSLIPHPSSLR